MNAMKNFVCFLLNLMIIFLFSSKAQFAQVIDKSFLFEKSKLKIEKVSGYDLIKYDDCEFSQQVGAPLVPVKIIQFALPPEKDIAGISIKNGKSENLEGEYFLFPAQPPRILSDNRVDFIPPAPNIYSSDEFFPKQVVEIAPSGYFLGSHVGALFIYPIQFLPSEKKIKFNSELEIEIIFKNKEKLPLYFKQTEYSKLIRNQSLKKIIQDATFSTLSLRKPNLALSLLPAEEHLYVIITSDNLVASFQLLADWKLKKGLSAKIIKTSYIYANYAGKDNQEKIRNFIIDAYQNWGTIWVLLGGDTDIIPTRKAFAFDCEYGDYSENYIPCDLYYSDLDGDWNADGDDIYGEVDDDIDMYPDVFVGRASVENSSEATAFINKILTYEKSAPDGHELNMLYLADILWTDPYTNSGDGKDLIDSLYVPDRFDPITKLYMHFGNENYTSVMNALNKGQNIINHDGHAWYTVMVVGDGSLQNQDMDLLNNGPKYSILYSIGCWPAAFDYDCIAEHFITNPNGGGVAFIGNSRYGWGSPGNAVYGYSDRFDQQFYKHLFIDNIYQIGNALSAAKSVYVPYAGQENVYRWCEYEVNLLGDPEMPIWTDTPRPLAVQYPTKLPLGNPFCSITVSDGSQPVEGALVCLMQNSDVYETELTGIDGKVSVNCSISNLANPLQLTVTAQNFIPFEGTISLFVDGPYVQLSSFATNLLDKSLITPDTMVSMDCWFKNYGSKPAANVSVALSSESRNIVMHDSTESIGNLQPGDSVYMASAFSFQTSSNLKNGEVVHVESKVTDSMGNSWNGSINMIGATPILTYAYYQIEDTVIGDRDNFAEPGETIAFKLAIQNAGLAPADKSSISLKSNSPYLSFPTSPSKIWNIPPGDTSVFSFDMSIDVGCPEPSFPQISMQIQAEYGYQFADSFFVSIGEFGIRDNMENGLANWTHSGSPDLWHLTSNRKHSGNFSWYCGKKEAAVYDNNMENSLTSQPFIIDENSELSFWCWYLCPNYGVNGFNPEINDGSGWRKLDFIGSGGALGILPTGNDWLKYTYDLSQYSTGTSLQLRFRFVSDDEIVTEGVYIDDVIIQNKQRMIDFYAPPRLPKPTLNCTEVNNKIEFSWDSNFDEIENYNQENYAFQGYNVYQLNSSIPVKSNGIRVTTFDIIDGVTEIVEDIVDPETGLPVQITQQHGSDSGIQRNFTVDRDYLENSHLVKGKPYYFAIAAYAYNLTVEAMPKCIESLLNVVEIVFQKNQPGYAYGDTIQVSQIAGDGDGRVIPIIMDPLLLTGHNYYVDFTAVSSDSLVWNLTDVTMKNVLLRQQTNFSGDENYPIVDGFKAIVKDVVQVDFSDLIVTGAGYYDISSYYQYNWAATSRAIDAFGRGTTDKKQLGKDYEIRFTGQYENPGANIVYIKQGTGSIATIYGARYYELKDHPMNPNPGSNNPFTVRIPFEVWNADDNRQVNILIYDRIQQPGNLPFYAFNPIDRMYCFILITPYHESVADFSGNELDNLTWNLVFWQTQFNTGDVIKVIYDNAIAPEDVFAFTTTTDTFDNGGILPKDFELYQNYPNPFNNGTTFRFDLPKPSIVTLKIYNILGEEVETVIREQKMIGKCEVNWNVQDLASGLYFYRIKAGDFIKTRKFILLK